MQTWDRRDSLITTIGGRCPRRALDRAASAVARVVASTLLWRIRGPPHPGELLGCSEPAARRRNVDPSGSERVFAGGVKSIRWNGKSARVFLAAASREVI